MTVRRAWILMLIVAFAAAFAAPVAAQDDPETTTTTIELSSPTASSTVPVSTTTLELSSPTATSVPTEVLGVQEVSAQEGSDDELALTGLGAGPLAALALVLLIAGSSLLIGVNRSTTGS